MLGNAIFLPNNIFLAIALGLLGNLALRFKIKNLEEAIIYPAVIMASYYLAGFYGVILAGINLGKSYFSSSILISLVLFGQYLQEAETRLATRVSSPAFFSLSDPFVLLGLFAGVGIIFFLNKYLTKLKFWVYPIAIITPVICGFTLGPVALGGMLLGLLTASFLTPCKTMGTVLQFICVTSLLIVRLIA